MKRNIISLIVIALCFFACKKEHLTEIILSNNSDFDLTDKPISIKRDRLSTDSINNYPLLINVLDTIPSQLNDLDEDGNWDELFFVANFSAQEEKKLTLKWVNKKPNYVVRTSARFGKRNSSTTPVQPKTSETMLANELPKSLGYQQYQTDGPSWENDKVGFRHYLDGRNAKDLFGKKVSTMSPEHVGINAEGAVEDNYHVMGNWGRDILAVGNSIGIGGYALATETELMRLGVTVDDSINNIEKTTFKILVEGPIKSILNYNYENWKPNGENRNYSVEEYTTIFPGIYGYKNTVSISGIQGDENLVVGLVNINNDKPLSIIDENENYIVLYTHDKQTYDKKWWLGMALIVPKELYLGYTEAPKTGPLSNTYLAKLKVENKQPVSYYAIAGWELSDTRFIDEAYFINYLKKLTNQLSVEVDMIITN
ncbi:DUF4861 domain-containing protein [Thalassobellus suaedae]|uniref:DUF4861 domain-containing protein n=1 Tax=Thalassobellus suaedae TaxID=3074124 RepID=A0ABY9Y495_9FLAO|nr:DUF4861 domain-containing protein [Flavobacteriaceae bacterium HL-DH10]